MLRRIALACLVTLAPLGLATPGAADPATLKAVQAYLYTGQTEEASAAAAARLLTAPDDEQARFALGAVQFLQAVENLGQAFHRYGLASGDSSTFGGMIDLPFVRVPVPPNPQPRTARLRDVSQHPPGFCRRSREERGDARRHRR